MPLLKRESITDTITILISYLVMSAYISLALGDTPRFTSFYISSKMFLGLSGVMVVMLYVIPFLVLAGMSDLLSLILFIMQDESEAFWCFVSLMERFQPNFNCD
ncbi:unnamed protein product [Lactuca saligna]|uniref:Rab-GAP TBC domain-containing protein n=1 Tax=Lactuca saligna TaxID=75948 RepID=A0AA35ZRC8_LACSI|nr:unnamed protein product [Lactuca saligna]